MSSCIEWGFPKILCCSGCVRFATCPSVSLDIDDRDHDAAMLRALSKRFTSREYVCAQPWKKNLDCFQIGQATMAESQKEFIKDVRGLDPD